MGKTYAYFSKLTLVFVSILVYLSFSSLFAQTYNDGPIQLQAKLRRFNLTFAETDIAFFGIVGQPDDMTYYVWGRDNADVDGVVTNSGWGTGTGCLIENYVLPLTDFNFTFFNFTYLTPLAPQFLDLRLDTWEDESPDQLLGIGCGGGRCSYDVNFCCGGFFFGICLGAWDDDDLRCNSGTVTPYATLNYRLGPPCQWYSHGGVGGVCANNVYFPTIETYWRYTRGDACASAIDLGNIAPGFSAITHFNSNQCYTNQIPTPGGGQDVVYQILVSQPTGLVVNTCGAGSMPTNVVILNSACTQIYSNNGACGNGSQISTPICSPGIYYVVVEGRAGATGTFTLSISENPNLVVRSEAGPNVSVCIGLGVRIGAQLPAMPATGGQGPYTYLWSPATNIVSTTDSITTVFPPVTTTYTLTVTDALGCVSRDSVIVTVNPGPAVNIGPDRMVCPGTSVNLNAGPGFTSYFWSTGAFTQGITAVQPGQYIAVVADLNGCTGRDTMLLSNYPTPVVNLGPDQSICAGTLLPLNAGGPFASYLWNTGATVQTISTSASGVFSVAVTDGNSCTGRDTITITVDTLPVPVLPLLLPKCPDNSVVINPGAGWPTYLWSNGSINQMVVTNVAGPYSVTVTDGNGCVGIASTNVVDNTRPLGFGMNAPANFFCQGSALTLDAGSGPGIAAYLWSTGATTQTVTVNSSGWYRVTATDVNGCVWRDSILVTAAPIPVVELGPDQTICQGSNTLISAPAGFSYNWSTGAAGQIINVTTPGMYYVTVTNPGTNCSAVDSVRVNVTPLPAPALPATVPLCGGQSFTLNPGSGFASYLWSTGANSQSISVTTPGTYTVTVSNASGCTATALCTITNYAPVVAAVSGNTNGCLGIPQTLVATGGFSSYLWSNGATTQAITVNGTGQYTVTVTSVNGCTATASLNVTFGPLPVVNMAPFDTICQGQVATLNAGPGFSSYLWSTGATTQTITAGGAGVYSVTVTNANGCSNSGLMTLVKSDVFVIDLGPATMSMCDRGILLLNASPRYVDYLWSDGSVNQTLVVTQPGLYSVTVTDMYGCQSSDAVTVTSNGVTQMDFLPADLTMCAGESFIIDAGSQWLYYSWANGSADQYHATTQPGVFYVTVTDPSGCRFSDSVKVVVDSPPTLELGANQNLCPGESITLDAGTGFNSYVWSTGQTTQTIAVTDPRSYSVTVTFNTCTLTDITNVGEDCPGRIFIPNVFSPNGDGLNDFFKIDYVNLDRLTVTVFDRWGKFLYTSNDKNFGWDGKYNNNPLPEGTYYYVVRYVLTDNANELEAKGTVMIIR